jgi:hypothetical protein
MARGGCVKKKDYLFNPVIPIKKKEEEPEAPKKKKSGAPSREFETRDGEDNSALT